MLSSKSLKKDFPKKSSSLNIKLANGIKIPTLNNSRKEFSVIKKNHPFPSSLYIPMHKNILIAPRLRRPAIPHMRALIQGDAPVLRRRHPIDVPAAQPCALGEMSPPHHSALVMAGLGWLEQGHARSVTIAAAQSSQGSLAESLACRVCFT